MRDCARQWWMSGVFAAGWCGFDWLFGGQTSLREFAEWSLLVAASWWAIDLIIRSVKAIGERRECRQMERDVKARYFELTGKIWDDEVAMLRHWYYGDKET